MTHKEAERSIPSFFDESIENLELSEFLDHIDRCPECKEELTIQFLVNRGLQSLSAGDEFNLTGELDKKLSKAHARLNRLYRMERFSWVLRAVVLVETVILFVLTLRIWI